MRRVFTLGFAAIGVVVAVGAVIAVIWVVGRHDGFSANTEPSTLEAFVARRLRLASIPDAARTTRNPVPLSPAVLEEARAHYADHCATCHGADGAGKTDIGRNLYPKAPDLRATDTQRLSDGELFFIIENGVRFTGMPAWGGAGGHGEGSWQLVHFLRRLPLLTVADVEAVARLMPRSPEGHDEGQGHSHGDGHAHSGEDADHPEAGHAH